MLIMLDFMYGLELMEQSHGNTHSNKNYTLCIHILSNKTSLHRKFLSEIKQSWNFNQIEEKVENAEKAVFQAKFKKSPAPCCNKWIFFRRGDVA